MVQSLFCSPCGVVSFLGLADAAFLRRLHCGYLIFFAQIMPPREIFFWASEVGGQSEVYYLGKFSNSKKIPENAYFSCV